MILARHITHTRRRFLGSAAMTMLAARPGHDRLGASR